MSRPAGWLAPEWAGGAVGALMSTREGGVSRAPYPSMNLGDAVGDDADHVAVNRAVFAKACGAAPVFLRQVHGRAVVRIGAADAALGAVAHEADASCTTEAGIACTVLAADCLPVLFMAPDGRAVAAAHAGWRGLATGVLEATVSAVCEAGNCQPAELQVWLGACVGPRAFEVGAEVLEAFAADPAGADAARFVRGRPGKWFANLPLLARDRLAAVGLGQIDGGRWCTVEDASDFFSFRRDGVTGRMAAAIWIIEDRSFGAALPGISPGARIMRA